MAEEKSQYQLDQEQRQADRRARSEARKIKKEAGRSVLGGRTLSEALRGTTSTKQRRAIKDAYESAKTKATDPFVPKSSSDFSPADARDLATRSLTIVSNGEAEELDILTL